MKSDEQRTIRILCVLGIIPVVWLALLVAPFDLNETLTNSSPSVNRAEILTLFIFRARFTKPSESPSEKLNFSFISLVRTITAALYCGRIFMFWLSM